MRESLVAQTSGVVLRGWSGPKWSDPSFSTPAAMLAVLLHARALLVRDGWARGVYPVDARGLLRERDDGDPWTLVDALNDAPVTVERWQARLLLQRVAGTPNLVEWNAHPYREGREAVELLDKAIRELGAVPPPEKYRERSGYSGRKRGPIVTIGRGGRLP